MTSASVSSEHPRDWRSIVGTTLVVAAVIGGFYLLYRFRVVVFLMLGAFILNIAITPLVNWLVRQGRSRPVAVTLVYVVFLLVLILFGFAVGPMLYNQVNEFTAQLPRYYNNIRLALTESDNYLLKQVALSTPDSLDMLMPQQPRGDAASLGELNAYLKSFRKAIYYLFIGGAMFLLAYYWNLENQRIKLWLLRFAAPDRRETIRSVLDEIESTVGGFLGGQMLLGLLIGVASLVIYLVIGLPYAVALAVLSGIFELIPLVGPTLSAAVALLVALSNDPSKAFLVVIAAIILQALENYILVPRVMGQSVGVNPFVTLLALTAFGALFGIAGALLAIPLAAILQIAFNRLLFNLDSQRWTTITGRDKLAYLRYEAHNLVYDVRKGLRRKEARSTDSNDSYEDIIEAIATTIEKLAAPEKEQGAPA